jgi:hypothetical protein
MVSLLTAFIAIIVTIITLLQWITARQKVVLDLFDRSLSIARLSLSGAGIVRFMFSTVKGGQRTK